MAQPCSLYIVAILLTLASTHAHITTFTPSPRAPRAIPDGCVVARSGDSVVLTDCHMYRNRTLDLSQTGLTDIQPQAFVGTSLLSLDLHDNQLHSLTVNAFQYAYRLEHLRLDGNQLTTLPYGLFDKFTQLKRLYLHENSLGLLHPRLFELVCSTLTDLDLSNNNIPDIQPQLLVNCNKLKALSLIGNPIDVERISPDVFEQLPELLEPWWTTMGAPYRSFGFPNMHTTTQRTQTGKHHGTNVDA